MPQVKEKTKKTIKASYRFRKGGARERLVKSQLEGQGWCVVKAAGSLGVFDLIALHPDNNICLLIQVKSNKLPGVPERERIMSFLVPNYCQKLIWRINDGKPKEPEIYVCGRNMTRVSHEWYLKQEEGN